MTALPFLSGVALHVRSYGAPDVADRHPFAQLVLPLEGMLELEIGGRGVRADPLHGAVVAPGAWHAQRGPVPNRSLIVDIDAGNVGIALAHGPWARLLERPCAPLDAAARKLVEFMGIMAARSVPADGSAGGIPAALLVGWTPLLLDTLCAAAPQPRSRLAALLARVEAAPGQPWSVDAMARSVGVSVSRLHALFREQLDAAPHAWLQGVRLARACAWLADTERPIAEIALAAGFSEQSALTRAMRRALGTTPAAYRRGARETRSTAQ